MPRVLSPFARLLATIVPAALCLVPAACMAATFQIKVGSQNTTFAAPLAGGPISAFAVTIDSVLFDSPEMGSVAPIYDAADNDIQGAGSLFGSFRNSISALPGCPLLSCVLAFEDRADPATPPVWAAFPLVNNIPGQVFASGSYTITPPGGPAPIPLPAPALLLGAAVGLAALAGRRARSGAARTG